MNTMRGRGQRFQRGATVVMMALVMGTVALTALVSVDVGYLFFQQRKLQNIADMAALAAVQSIPGRVDVAAASATANGFTTDGAADSVTATAGYWDPALVAAAPHFTETIPAGAAANAVRVEVEKQNSTFFAGMVAALSGNSRPVLQAAAIARIDTMVGLSLGTGVARLSDVGPLNSALTALLGVNVALDLASYQGLANANIRLGDLMAELGVSSVDQLIGLSAQLPRVVEAGLNVATRQGVLSGAIAVPAVATALVAGVRNLAVRVAANAGDQAASILSIAALLGNREAAADAQINVLDLITTGAQVANAAAGINISGLNINLGPLAGVTVQTRIINPPVIAIGPPGTVQTGPRAGQWQTMARSAAATVRLTVRALNLGVVDVNLPLQIDVAPATAWVADAQCAVPREDSTATIGVNTGIAGVCIANLPTAMGPVNCAALGEARIANITLPLLPLIQIWGHVPLQLQTGAQTLQFTGDEIGDTKTVAVQGVGQALANALFSPSTSLRVVLLGIPLGIVGDVITTVLRPVLYPVLLLLDTILTPVLGLLGIKLGFSDVTLTSISCNRPALVF